MFFAEKHRSWNQMATRQDAPVSVDREISLCSTEAILAHLMIWQVFTKNIKNSSLFVLPGGEVLCTKCTNKSAPKWDGADLSSLRWMRSLRMDRSAVVLLMWPRYSEATVQHMTVKKKTHPVLINGTSHNCLHLIWSLVQKKVFDLQWRKDFSRYNLIKVSVNNIIKGLSLNIIFVHFWDVKRVDTYYIVVNKSIRISTKMTRAQRLAYILLSFSFWAWMVPWSSSQQIRRSAGGSVSTG